MIESSSEEEVEVKPTPRQNRSSVVHSQRTSPDKAPILVKQSAKQSVKK